MKKNPFLIILLILLSVGLYYFNNQKPLEKETTKTKFTPKNKHNYLVVKNAFIDSNKKFSGIICTQKKHAKTSKINGEIDFIKKGMFKEGELLVRYNNTDLFMKLSSDKKILKDRLTAFINELDGDSKIIWSKFLAQISPEKVLVPFPESITKDEIALLKKHDCISIYNKLVDLEYEMEDYFILADFNGEIETSFVKPGDKINVNDTLLTLTDDTPILVKIKSKTNDYLKEYSTVSILNSDNEKIGSGSYFYKNKTHTYFKFTPFKNNNFTFGQVVIIELKKNGTTPYFKLPKDLLRVDSNITLLNNKKIKLNVLKEEENYFTVSGLKDGDSIKLDKN